MIRQIVYVHCKDQQSFRNYQENNLDLDCLYISDEYFLRGRWPAKIVIEEDADMHDMHDPIMESISTHNNLWRDELNSLEEKEELNNKDNEEEFYAG